MTAAEPAPSRDISRGDRDGVVTLTFTRDQKLNAVTENMVDVIRATVEEVADRPDLRVLVLTAAGRYFTAGIDMVSRQPPPGQREDDDAPGSEIRRYHRRLHRLLDELEALEKPVVLAAQGPCLGLGLEMAVSCDFRLASEAATFWLPEVPNLAVIPGSGGVSRLTRVVGPHWSRWLAMAGKPVDADRAMAIGLVHEVYPLAEFEASVQAFSRYLFGLPGEAMGLAKLAIDASVGADRASARDFDRVANTALLMSAEHRQHAAAFRRSGTRS